MWTVLLRPIVAGRCPQRRPRRRRGSGPRSGRRRDRRHLTNDGGETYGSTGGRLDFWGEYNGQFLDDDGDSARATVGRYVQGDWTAGGTFEIPDVSATPNKTTDRVPGDCGGASGVGWLVRVHSRDYARQQVRTGFTNPSGAFNARFDQSPAFNIKAGDKATVLCRLETGDVVGRQYTVP